VGRILDWYKKHTGRESYPPAEDPGVQSVTQIYNYLRKYDYPTEVMGASFRNIGEILELAGCDLLTISPPLLAELQNTEGHLERKLDPEKAKKMDIPRLVMDRATFDQMHRENRMASEKLEEGIQGFSKALEVLEKLLAERLQKLEGAKADDYPRRPGCLPPLRSGWGWLHHPRGVDGGRSRLRCPRHQPRWQNYPRRNAGWPGSSRLLEELAPWARTSAASEMG
jgi:hypothetical protein